MHSKDLISIVEDDDSVRLALEGFVRSLGYGVRGYASAEDYLAVRDGRCACVITDVQLPGIDGLEMIARLRALRYEIPVIVVTARGTPAVEAKAYASGAFCFLAKPFDMPVLTNCLERALAA